ncbi:MAG TPA: hypothetical protein VGO45_05690 [Bacteroidia bacterium]|jgi:hypothetical protein|nr:hypothetical protein [Bacteroidia bacterium]
MHLPFRHIFFSLLIFLVFSENIYSQKNSKQYTVSGTITQTHSYCGGARPSDEMLARLNTPAPYAGKKLYIRYGNQNSSKKKIIRIISADSAGHFKIQLPSGTYCIIQDEQIKRLDIEHFKKQETEYLKLDENCLKNWWSQCFTTFEVKSENKTNLNINFNFPCFTGGTPCMQYTGPLPP